MVISRAKTLAASSSYKQGPEISLIWKIWEGVRNLKRHNLGNQYSWSLRRAAPLIGDLPVAVNSIAVSDPPSHEYYKLQKFP